MKKISKLLFIFIIFFSFTKVVNASTYYVTGDRVRVRASAINTDDNIIGKLNYGDIIDVIELKNSWYKIKYNDGYGYITYRYVTKVDDLNKTHTIALLKESTALKSSYSLTSKNILYIPKKAVVKVLKEKSGWAYIEYNEKTGYVKSDKLTKYSKTEETVIGTYTINYYLNNTKRKNNINKSVKKLNNIIIKPGEKFSFINIVGKNGYSKAPEFNKKEKITGGGLSEVATSLYLALRDAQRNGLYISVIEQNRNDSITPYAKLGEEAMIDIKKNKDLIFVNKSNKTIKIYSNISGNNISFAISEY